MTNHTANDRNGKCPDCGYDLKDGYDYCPRCGMVLYVPVTPEPVKPEPVVPEPVTQEPVVQEPVVPEPVVPEPAITPKANPWHELMLQPNTCDKCGKEVPSDYQFCPFCGERVVQKTIPVNRRRTKEVEIPKPRFTLTMMAEEHEEQEPMTHDYEGDEVVLNRANTDPNNRTITSKEQAHLTFEEGHWYIENRSELESTFVAASHKIELQPGDIVMMGDRCFRFDIITN